VHQIAHVGVTKRMGFQLFGRHIIFEIIQSVKIIPERHRQTDRQTDGETDRQTDDLL